MGKTFTSYRIEERSYVSFIKREIHMKATAAKFDAQAIAEIDIVVSEITSNLIKHATKGELLYHIDRNGTGQSLFEVLCIDRGPGMEDTVRMMRDGVSTTQTLGQGLGAIDRLSDFMQIFSMPGWGTVLYAKVEPPRKVVPRTGFGLEVKTLCVSKPGELVCGDGYAVKDDGAFARVFFADGLGHGQFAKDAVDNACDFFLRCPDTDPVAILRQVHEHIRRTRGLVGFVAVMDKIAGQWSLCGIGNILTRMYNGIEYKNFVSYNGTLGLNIPNSLKASLYPVERNQHLIMCSDGLQSRWDVMRYPAIFKFDNTLLAAALYKDFCRGTDDASTLIAKVT